MLQILMIKYWIMVITCRKTNSVYSYFCPIGNIKNEKLGLISIDSNSFRSIDLVFSYQNNQTNVSIDIKEKEESEFMWMIWLKNNKFAQFNKTSKLQKIKSNSKLALLGSLKLNHITKLEEPEIVEFKLVVLNLDSELKNKIDQISKSVINKIHQKFPSFISNSKRWDSNNNQNTSATT